MPTILSATNAERAGVASELDIPDISVVRIGQADELVVRINRFIAGVIHGPKWAKRATVFRLPNGNELAIRIRPFVSREFLPGYFHGYWNGVPFTSSSGVASRNSVAELKGFLLRGGVVLAFLALFFWLLPVGRQGPNAQYAILLYASLFATLQFAASLLRNNNILAFRIAMWGHLILIPFAMLIHPSVLMFGVFDLLWSRHLIPIADALGIGMLSLRSPASLRARRFRKAAIVVVEDVWDECYSCGFVPINLFPTGTKCPRCGNRAWTRSNVTFTTKPTGATPARDEDGSISPHAVCEFDGSAS